MTLKSDTKFGQESTCSFKIDEEFDKFWPEHSKVSKNFTLMGSFWVKKYIMFELKKYRGVIFHGTEKWCKIWKKTDLWFENWHEKVDKFLPEHLKVSKLGLGWDPFVQSRKCMSLKFTEKLYVMTMKNDVKFEEELTCHFKTDMKNLKNFDLNTKKSKRFALYLAPFIKVCNVWAKKSTEELCLMTLKIDAKFEGKMTCAFTLKLFARLIESLFLRYK